MTNIEGLFFFWFVGFSLVDIAESAPNVHKMYYYARYVTTSYLDIRVVSLKQLI
jgi:hypothetical protein